VAPTYLVIQGSQKAWPHRSTKGRRTGPSCFSFLPHFLALPALPGASPALLDPAPPSAPANSGAEGLPLSTAISSSPPAAVAAAAAAARRVALVAADLELLAAAASSVDVVGAGAVGVGGAGAGEPAVAAARAAAAAPAADKGLSKSSKQMGQLLQAYCWLRIAAWSRLMAASLCAQACSTGRRKGGNDSKRFTAVTRAPTAQDALW